MTDPTNDDRADWAKQALCILTDRTFGGDHPDSVHPDDLECAVADLITDLLHYAVRRGFEPGRTLAQAKANFEAELLEEPRP